MPERLDVSESSVKIQVQFFANLADDTHGDGVLEVPEGTTVGELVKTLRIPAELPRVVVVNGQDPAPGYRLVPGDVVAIFPPLAGG